MSPTNEQTILSAEAARVGVTLNEGARERLAAYEALIIEWNDRAGLTTVADSDGIQRRHFGESLALLAALRTAEVLPVGAARTLVDLGTGGGFPGLPMRIAEPALRLTLVESNGKKCAFLQATVDALGLDGVEVGQARCERAGRAPALRERFDVAVARALAAMPVLVEYAVPLLRPGGVLASPKGSRALDELEAARGAIAALGAEALAPLPLSLPEDAPPQLVLLVRRVGALDVRYPRRSGVPSKQPLT